MIYVSELCLCAVNDIMYKAYRKKKIMNTLMYILHYIMLYFQKKKIEGQYLKCCLLLNTH